MVKLICSTPYFRMQEPAYNCIYSKDSMCVHKKNRKYTESVFDIQRDQRDFYIKKTFTNIRNIQKTTETPKQKPHPSSANSNGVSSI